MKLSVPVSVALALLATPLLAQSTSKLKKELRKLERAAKKDPDGLYEAGKWAKEQSLAADAKRLFNKVLKYAPDHVGANEALGNEQIEGKWVPAADAQKMRAKALAAKYADKGYEQIKGIWVEPDNIADAKKGIFHHDGEVVSHEEKVGFQKGLVRHPKLGILIKAKYAEKAANGYYPLGPGRWGDLKEANQFHSDIEQPWFVRSTYATIISTLPLEKIEKFLLEADKGQEAVEAMFGHRKISPEQRPVIMIAKSQAEYRELGTALGDGTDAAGVFLMREEAMVKIPYQGEVRAAICSNDKNWGTRYVRHAAAITYANAIGEEAGADLPMWFLHGVGSMTSRFNTDPDAGWLGKQHLQKGGVMSVKSFFSGFDLNGEMDPKDIDYNMYQAGLMLSFATRGGDEQVTAAMLEVSNALSGKGGNASKAISNLEKQLIKSKDKIVEHLAMLVSKSQ